MVTGKPSEMELPEEERSSRRDSWPASSQTPAFRPSIIEKLLAVFGSHAPVGYEDETGFHFGDGPR